MSITYEPYYKGLRINTNREKKQGCDTNILDKIHHHISDMTANHAKVMSMRFDLRYPANASILPSAQHLHTFHRNLRRDLIRNNPLPQYGKERATSRRESRHHVDPRIIKVQEQHDKSSLPHIHCVVMVNAQIKQSAYDITKRVERQWAIALNLKNVDGLVDYCDKHGPNHVVMQRNSLEFNQQMHDAFHHASYLAKTRGKEAKHKGTWMVTASRISKATA